jgi:pSer/pThr/pTyr-binding forkhead associated (FHA) protein
VGEFCIVGRDGACDILLGDGLVSRRHLHIFAMTDRVILTDLMSTNGVYINGLRVDAVARLRMGDRIVLGTTELSVF